MASKLENLKVTSVSLVDRGANQKATVALCKRDPPGGEPETKDNDKGETPMENVSKATPSAASEPTVAAPATPPADEPMYKRLFEAVAKALGIHGEPIAKEARTFGEQRTFDEQDAVRREMWQTCSSLDESLCSIFDDDERNDAAKNALMKQSVAEFAEAMQRLIDKWTNAGAAGEAAPQADAITKDTEESESMNINKGAMSAEDKAAYEAIARKYGVEDADVSEQVAKAQAAAKEQIDALNDVVKKLTERIEAQAEAAEDAKMLAVAKRYELLGQKPEELARVLKGLNEAQRTAMLASLDTALKATEQSGLFAEIGKRGMAGEGGAWNAIEKHAAELRKADPGMSREDSIVKACDEHPELRAEYEGGR